MRLAEMYLTQAEALARAGKTTEAQEVFTKFQITRDPSYKSKGNSGDALAEEIMNSRRIELWGEGFRFYDLKRLNLPIKRGSNFDIAFCTFLERIKMLRVGYGKFLRLKRTIIHFVQRTIKQYS